MGEAALASSRPLRPPHSFLARPAPRRSRHRSGVSSSVIASGRRQPRNINQSNKSKVRMATCGLTTLGL